MHAVALNTHALYLFCILLRGWIIMVHLIWHFGHANRLHFFNPQLFEQCFVHLAMWLLLNCLPCRPTNKPDTVYFCLFICQLIHGYMLPVRSVRKIDYQGNWGFHQLCWSVCMYLYIVVYLGLFVFVFLPSLICFSVLFCQRNSLRIAHFVMFMFPSPKKFTVATFALGYQLVFQ